MRPEEVLLHAPREGRSIYRFTCPACLEPVEKPADRKIIALLVSAGVPLAAPTTLLEDATEPLLPLEPFDPMDVSPGGRAFTIDDLLDFHLLLMDDRYLEEFLERRS